MIHGEHLAAKKLYPELKTLLDDAMKINKKICSWTRDPKLCTTLGGQQPFFSLETWDGYWEGEILYTLLFNEERSKSISTRTKYDIDAPDEWGISGLGLGNRRHINTLNELNNSFQGSYTNFTLRNKMDAFRKELSLLKSRI
jgi:hypothetical protein